MTRDAVPAHDRGGDAASLITVLRDRAPRIAMALAATQAAWPAVTRIRARYTDRTTYTVKVPGNDEMYDTLHEWVLGLLPAAQQRALVAWSGRRGEMPIQDSSTGREPSPVLRLRYDGTREQVIRVAGHAIRVIVADPGQGEEGSRSWRPPELTFIASSADARGVLLAELAAAVDRSYAARRRPSFRMLDKWGDWGRLDDLPARTADSVILPAGQLERLTGDVARWLAAEQEYARRCVPWHRGHLYTGPPGTGKTSVARAIASHFGMDVWYLPLGDLEKDAELLRLVSRIGGRRSMLLLEDVDVFHAATRRDDDKAVTLSGLLNTLDGIATPHGLLTVLTTNTPGVLDPALIRPGRIDLTEEFGLAGEDQVRRLLSRWYDQPVSGSPVPGGFAPAAVVEVCKRHATLDGALTALTAARYPFNSKSSA